MKFIDRLIRNSNAFKDLRKSVDIQIDKSFYQHKTTLLEDYTERIEKLADLTERLHNTILSVKHNQDSH